MIDRVSLDSSRGISQQFDSIDPFNIRAHRGDVRRQRGIRRRRHQQDHQHRDQEGRRRRHSLPTPSWAPAALPDHEDHDLRAAQSISDGNDLFQRPPGHRLPEERRGLRRQWRPGTDGHRRPTCSTTGRWTLMGSLGFTFANVTASISACSATTPATTATAASILGATSTPLRGRAPYSIGRRRPRPRAGEQAPSVQRHLPRAGSARSRPLPAGYYRNEKMAFQSLPTIRYGNTGAIRYGTSTTRPRSGTPIYYGMNLALVEDLGGAPA